MDYLKFVLGYSMKKLICFFIIMTVFYVNLLSDEFVVKSFIEDVSDLAARTSSKRDINDEFCAIIKVRTDLTNLTFYSNQLEDIDHKESEYWLYVSPGIRYLEISKLGFIKSGYKIPVIIKSQTVYVMELTKNKYKIPINIITTPGGAIVSIDGKQIDTDKSYQVSEGKHNLKIVKDGFKTVEKDIHVTETSNLFNITMESIKLTQLIINSKPTGASIKINGGNKGFTNKGLWLFPGKYDLKLSLKGYYSINQEIVVNENDNNTFSFNFKNKINLCKINIKVYPEKAKIFINKENFSNKKDIQLSPGRYKIEISKFVYMSISDWLIVESTAEMNKEFNLLPLTGSFRFNIQPIDASIKMYNDNKIWNEWIGMKYWESVPIGSYSIVCKARGYKDNRQKLSIESMKTLDLDIIMDQEKSKSLLSWINNHKMASIIIGGGLTVGSVAILYISNSRKKDGDPLPDIDNIWPPK